MIIDEQIIEIQEDGTAQLPITALIADYFVISHIPPETEASE